MPRYLKVLRPLGITLCVEHGGCYTSANVARHLARSHSLKAGRVREILEFIKSTGPIALCPGDVPRPAHGGRPISGLPIYDGYGCDAADCNFLTVNEDSIKQHCFKLHNWKRKLNKSVPYRAVKLQTLWAKTQHVEYFIVAPPANQSSGSSNGDSAIGSSKTPLLSATEAKSGWNALQIRFKEAQDKRAERYSQVQVPAHISEITPWLKSTGYHIHLAELNVEDLAQSYRLPDGQDEPLLATVCASMERVLRKVMGIMEDDVLCENRRLNRLNAKLLNTFRGAEMSQDPIKPLQNKRSANTYIQTWQKLTCYFYRVKDGECLREDLFRPTERQLKCAGDVMEAANDVKLREEQDKGEDGEEGGAGTEEAMDKLDKLALDLSLAFIQQRLDMRAFDSPMVSFAAVLAWDSKECSWMKIGYYTSYLSHLIYDSQLIIFQHCLDALDVGKAEDLSGYLVSVRDQWLLNDSPGPIGELLATRLLGSRIAQNTVGQAHVRWHSDEQTVVYKDIKFTMTDLRDLVEQELVAARKIFYRDLCFGLENVPVYKVHKLSDNWDLSQPGGSFLLDSRNKEHLGGGDRWLLDNLRLRPDIFGLLVLKKADGEWQVSSDAAYQYECAVQRFLEHMMVCIHISSGQPARKPEFLGTRWCNKQADKRNLFIHDGYLLFILTYHKSLNQTNACRWPVRFLLPEVGELMVQYMVLILSFRIWLKEEVLIPEDVSEYLWSQGKDTWTEDKMTRVLVSETKATISMAINAQKWRQMAIGIGIKKFAGLDYQLDLDLPGDVDDPDDGPSGGRGGHAMPEVFHWQASHGPRTGNQAYGGTVNFRNGLTDAGLQEYLRASQMWHGLCRDAVQTAAKGTRQDRMANKHHREGSKADALDTPLAKRIAYRKAPLRHRRRWTMEEAAAALRDLYGPQAQYKSAKQEEALQVVLDGVGQVVAILGTGEGKSLLFMLPSMLPSAGTTVVMLPLIGLKHDMMRRLDCMGLGYKVWECTEDEEVGCPLVFVSVDKAVSVTFRSYLNRLEAGNGLDRVIFDESHLAITASQYRPKMKLVKYLRSLRCQFVYLTATLPPTMVNRFEQAMLLYQPRMIRSLTVRTDLEYWVRRSSIARLQDFALAEIRATLQESWFIQEQGARCIIYTTTRPEADEVAERLQCLVYYSDSGTDEEKALALAKWVAGESQVMVATGAFGPGINHAHVRAVFHIGAPASAIDFAQEAGRAGRDDEGGISCVFLPKNWKAVDVGPAGELLPDETKVMQRYLDNPRCRLLPLSIFLDKVPQTCKGESTSCDRCRELGILVGADEIELAAASKSREDGVGMLEGADESESSSSAEDLEVGGRLLKQHVRDQERCLQRYIGNLKLLKGSCLLCRLVDSVDPSTLETVRGADHALEKCRSVGKWRFFNSKRAAIEEGQRRFSAGQRRHKGWLSTYTSCFKCGNPQTICVMQGKGQCEYADILMPACWGAYQREIWRGQVLKQLAGRDFKDELEYMLWLGEEREVYGQKACNMMFIGNQVMIDILSGL